MWTTRLCSYSRLCGNRLGARSAESLRIEPGSLDFDRRIGELMRADYLDPSPNITLTAQGVYKVTLEGIAAADEG